MAGRPAALRKILLKWREAEVQSISIFFLAYEPKAY